jgi:hypothetical protein
MIGMDRVLTRMQRISDYRVYRTHRTEQAQRQVVAQTLDGGIEGRLAKSVAEIAKSTGTGPGELAESLANHINAEKDRLRAAGYYDPLYKKVWRRLRGR